eukprot:Colp12_sorted_trinity150504_noHs@434
MYDMELVAQQTGRTFVSTQSPVPTSHSTSRYSTIANTELKLRLEPGGAAPVIGAPTQTTQYVTASPAHISVPQSSLLHPHTGHATHAPVQHTSSLLPVPNGISNSIPNGLSSGLVGVDKNTLLGAPTLPTNVLSTTGAVPVKDTHVDTSGGQENLFLNFIRHGLGSTSASQEYVVQGQRQLERRRESHNEVERRRRDNINSCINKLAEMVPDCATQKSMKLNKGLILKKTASYIKDLQDKNESLQRALEERDSHDHPDEYVKSLKMKVEELTKMNEMYRRQLQEQAEINAHNKRPRTMESLMMSSPMTALAGPPNHTTTTVLPTSVPAPNPAGTNITYTRLPTTFLGPAVTTQDPTQSAGPFGQQTITLTQLPSTDILGQQAAPFHTDSTLPGAFELRVTNFDPSTTTRTASIPQVRPTSVHPFTDGGLNETGDEESSSLVDYELSQDYD